MKTPKTTMIDYLNWRGDLEFTRDEINEVDCLVFASLAYFDFKDSEYASTANLLSAPTLSQVYAETKDTKCFGSMYLPLFRKCAISRRFKDVKVMYYRSVLEPAKETQFSAVTFVLPSGEVVVAYRGTDDSLVGWQEDLNMSLGMIPAQKYARRYVCDVADAVPEKPLYIVGHSKGGNLAVWAGAYLYDIYFDRIKAVYDFDGPGFCTDFIESEEYKKIAEKTTKYVVDASIVGMLLSSYTEQTVVDSVKHNSVLQHITNTWAVTSTRLCRMKTRSSRGLNSQAVIEELIESLTYDERKQLTTMVAGLVQSADIERFSELKSIETIPRLLEFIKKNAVSDEEKQLVQSIMKRLAVIVKNQTLSRTGLSALSADSKEI